MRVLFAVAALAALVLFPLSAEADSEPRLEMVSGEPDASPAYTDFAHHLKVNLHTWWQRDGHRTVPLSQRWRVGVSQIGMAGLPQGVAVWVKKLGAPLTIYPGPEWNTEQVFMFYPLAGWLAEPAAALASAAAIEFIRGKAADAAAGEKPKR